MKLKISTRAHSKLKALGEEVMNEIDRRLLAGEPASSLAAWLQVDLGKLKDVQPASAKKMLERYRETELRDKTLARIAAVQTNDSIKTVSVRLNAMDELEDMVRIQSGRLRKLLTQEEGLPNGIINKAVNPEMRLLKEMMVDLGRLQLETGVLARASKTFKGTVTTEEGEVRHFEWTEEQEKLFSELSEAVSEDQDA